MSTIANLLADLPGEVAEEHFTTVLETGNIRIERIVSHGQASPPGFWYDQDQAEFVVLLQGAARLRFEDEIIQMIPGSFINIQPHRRHRVEWTVPNEPTIWLAIHYSDGSFAS